MTAVPLLILRISTQILEMFTREVWTDYLAEYQGRNQRYPQVHPRDVLQLMKKYVQGSTGGASHVGGRGRGCGITLLWVWQGCGITLQWAGHYTSVGGAIHFCVGTPPMVHASHAT